MNRFLTKNTARYKLARTIVQGIIAVLIARLPEIMGLIDIPSALQAISIPFVMAVLSPIMAYMGGEELPQTYFEGDDEHENKSE